MVLKCCSSFSLLEENDTMEPLGTWNLELRTWNLKLGTWNLELGTWNLELGTWNLLFYAVSTEYSSETSRKINPDLDDFLNSWIK